MQGGVEFNMAWPDYGKPDSVMNMPDELNLLIITSERHLYHEQSCILRRNKVCGSDYL